MITVSAIVPIALVKRLVGQWRLEPIITETDAVSPHLDPFDRPTLTLSRRVPNETAARQAVDRLPKGCTYAR